MNIELAHIEADHRIAIQEPPISPVTAARNEALPMGSRSVAPSKPLPIESGTTYNWFEILGFFGIFLAWVALSILLVPVVVLLCLFKPQLMQFDYSPKHYP